MSTVQLANMKLLVVFAVTIACTLGAPSTPQRSLDQRIVGGKPATRSQFPHQISYQRRATANGNWGHLCGGSILTPTFVLSAGHCITEVPTSGQFRIVAGIISLKENHQDRQESAIAKKIIHPKYQGKVNPYDLVIFQLQTPLKFSNSVKAIALPKPNEIPTGSSILSGWGSTSTTSQPSMPDALQTVELPVLTYQQCEKALIDKFGTSKPLDKTNVCTGPLTGGQAACSGDSGGPLIQNGKLIGVVSWGVIPCGQKGAPSVYVQVSSFIDFIKQHVTNLPGY